jgi:hypothetical protein
MRFYKAGTRTKAAADIASKLVISTVFIFNIEKLNLKIF